MQVLELEVGEVPLGLETPATDGRGLGKSRAQFFDELGRRNDRQQVGLGEVAVVVGVGLGSTGRGLPRVFVPVPGLLRDRSAVVEDGGLALDLVADGPLDAAQRVDVLRLGAGSERSGRLALGGTSTKRDVGVAAQVSALHARLGDAEAHDDVADGGDVRLRELRSIVLGAVDDVGDDLDEGNTGSVVVDERVLGALDATGRAAHVGELAGVLLHVRALDRHREQATVRQLDLDRARERDGLVALRDLVVLREVGVEVVLAGEAARGRDRAAEREAQADRVAHRLAVDDGQRTRQAEVDGRDVRVGLAAEVVRRVREHLGLGAELDVHLEAEHRLEEFERAVVVHQFRHQTAPSSVAFISLGDRSGAWLRSVWPHFCSSSASSAAATP